MLSVGERRAGVKRKSPLPVTRQCRLLDINRSGYYYQPKGISDLDIGLMKMIDRHDLEAPFYGARKIAVWLKSRGYSVNRKRVMS